jgi:hypothetical protein
MEATFYLIDYEGDRQACAAWLVENAVPELLIRLFYLPSCVPLSSAQHTRVSERIRSFELQAEICAALGIRRRPQPIDDEFLRFLEVVTYTDRHRFNDATEGLIRDQIVRVVLGRGTLCVSPGQNRAIIQGYAAWALRGAERYRRPEDFRGGPEQVIQFKHYYIRDWVKELGAVRLSSTTWRFFDEWSPFSSELMRGLIDEMVADGQLRPCLIRGVPGVTV